MDGDWHLYQPGQRWRRPGHQARAVLTTRLVGHLSLDLLQPDWDGDDAARATRRLAEPSKSGRPCSISASSPDH